MKKSPRSRKVSRRDFLALGGKTLAVAAGFSLLPATSMAAESSTTQSLGSATGRELAALAAGTVKAILPSDINRKLHLAATDGWVYLPGTPISEPGVSINYYPDPLAATLPDGSQLYTTYVFGFRDVTSLVDASGNPDLTAITAVKGHAQVSAPLLYVDQEDKVTITLTNLGLQQRPDLVDSHTIHWHGFRNAIPLFDGVPEMSISVPIGRDFTYFYYPHDPGTYMYHCHFEDVEHVHMGMTGVVFVRPLQNKGLMKDASGNIVPAVDASNTPIPAGKYAYNDGVQPGDPKSSAYDREFTLFMSEVWAKAHYNDAHIQPTDWSEYHPDFWLMNGRSYPDTTQPGGDPLNLPAGATVAQQRLQYQPISSLIAANENEKILLRFVSLSYQQTAMTLPGITMRTVGKDAVYLYSNTSEAIATRHPRNNPVSTEEDTNTVYFGPGESVDAIFTAPPFVANDPNIPVSTDANGKQYNTYLLYNRNFYQLSNGSADGNGGQMTEIHVYPANTLVSQTAPNT